ncbi:MAG: response regulator transcription factor [Thermodesulfobacteriota bacterium]|nr:response regulator transcription factor [Thermodesulfobacteriota bacterium]
MNNEAEKKRILIIEDESHIAEALKLNLSLRGYDPMVADNGIAGLEMWQTHAPDLIVLDIMLPGIDGLSVLQHIRLEDERIPVLILSAKNEPADRIKGLAYGVDDYLTKPFELEEFLLRVDRLLTRSAWARVEAPSVFPANFSFGDNEIDFETAKATCKQGEITLTDQELKLIKIFIMNKGKPLSRKQLLEIGWGYRGETSTRTLDNFIVRLRKYFEDNPKKPKYFKSMRTVGYVFDDTPDE